MPAISFSKVSKYYGKSQVLADIDLEIGKGDTVAVIGPSGSGKTTLLRCINFLVPYDEGRVTVNGMLMGYADRDGRLVRLRERQIVSARRNIGFVFQKFGLFPHKTVLENLVEGPIHVLRRPKEEAVAEAMDRLREVGLEDKRHAYPANLSGGQQQRVGIARALAMNPEVLLLDEVTSALDPELVGEVLEIIRSLSGRGITMVLVTHEIQFAREVANRIVFMEDGRIVSDKSNAEFFSEQQSDRITSFLKRSASRQ